MPETGRQMRERSDARPGDLPREALEPAEPLVLRGLVSDWPAVQAGKASPAAAIDYLRRFYANATVNAVRVPARQKGRVFYNEDLSGFNFEPFRARLDEVLARLEELLPKDEPDTVYVGSTTVDTCLPGFRTENDLSLGAADPLVSIWLGNRSRVAAHFDLPDNIACCVAGRRRFTLFAPDQIANLYPGPVDFTPAGQIISLVDFHSPDLERFPRFEEALRHARVVDLEPGDAIVIPSMWWHHVEAQEPFNVLINYWWRRSPRFMDSPTNVLEYALLALRDLPPEQRDAWNELFRYYVFEFSPEQLEYLPESRRGPLGPMDEMKARRLRAQLLNRLNR
jgi:hypothetical protein